MPESARRPIRPLLGLLVAGLLVATAVPAHARAADILACPSTSQCSLLVQGDQTSDAILTFDPHAPGFPAPAKTGLFGFSPAGTHKLACPSVSQCTELAPGSGDVVTFDPAHPGSPTPVNVFNPASQQNADLACPSVTQCTAVFGGGEVTFNPAAPGTPTPVNVDPGSGGLHVACPSATQCTEADSSSPAHAVVTFDPTAPGTPARSLGYFSATLECPSTSLCVAGDGVQKLMVFDPTNAPTFPNSPTAKTGPEFGSSLSCPSVTQCTGLGRAGESGGIARTFDPAAYPTISATSGVLDQSAYPVICPSTSECIAIGRHLYGRGYSAPAEATFDQNSPSSPQMVPLAPDSSPTPTPTPSPTPHPAPSPTPAAINAAVSQALAVGGAAAKIAAILKAGAYPAKITAPGAGTASIAWYYVPKGAHVARKKPKPKPVLIASGTKRFTTKGTATLKVKLTSKGRAMLKKVKHGHKLTLTAKGSFTPKGSKKTTTKKKAISLKR